MHDGKSQGKFTYREFLGPTPRVEAGDHEAARMWVDKIIRAIERGGWTGAERQKLIRMRRAWQRRASGYDDYFNKWGNGCQRSERDLRKEQEQAERERMEAKPQVPAELNELGAMWKRKSSESEMKPKN